jgi:hypothetical protein
MQEEFRGLLEELTDSYVLAIGVIIAAQLTALSLLNDIDAHRLDKALVEAGILEEKAEAA